MKLLNKQVSREDFVKTLGKIGVSTALIGILSQSASAKAYLRQTDGTTVDIDDLAFTPGGSDGDLQINDSGAFGTLDGLNLDKTGNARGSGSLDIQSARSAVTEVASSADSVAFGVNNTASGSGFYGGNCTAVGVNNTASGGGNNSAIGYNNTASGSGYYNGNSSAIGNANTASAYGSSAFGHLNTASAYNTTAFGYQNTASGQSSLAVGYLNTASGYASFALGTQSNAAGSKSGAIGIEQASYADDNIRVGNSSSFFNLNTTGFSVNNMNALVGFHATSDLLVTDIESLGAEKVTNGTFTNSTTGWTLGTGWTFFDGGVYDYVVKSADGTGTLSQTSAAMVTPLVVGEYYLLTFKIRFFSVGTLDISLGGQSVEQLNADNSNERTYKAVIKATTTGDLIFTPSNTARIQEIDDVSVKKITGGDVQPLGDITFLGAGRGLSYGAMYQTAGSTFAVTLVNQNTAYELDAATTNINAGELNRCTFPDDHYILVEKAGKYKVDYNLEASINSVAGGAQHIEACIMVTGTAEADKGSTHNTYAATTGEHEFSGTAILDLAANAQISLCMNNNTSAGKIMTIDHLNLNCVQIGG